MLYSIKMILRSWKRNALSSAISTISLTVGLTCSLTLLLYVLNEYKISQSLGDPAGVYQFKSGHLFDKPGALPSNSVTASAMDPWVEAVPEVEYAVLLTSRDNYKWGKLDRYMKGVPPLYSVSPELTELFDLPVEQGDLAATLADPSQVAITRSFANLYFEDGSNPMGQTIEGSFSSWANGQEHKRTRTMTVTTILDDSKPLPLTYSGLCSYVEADDPRKQNVNFSATYAFVKLHEGVDVDEFTARLNTDSATMKLTKLSNYKFTSVGDLYLVDDVVGQFNENQLVVTRSRSVFYIGITAAMAILVIACFNYVNITMTRAASRLRNIAGQRIMGASSWSVRWQTVLDTAMQVVVAMVLSLCMMVYILPSFNSFMESNLTLWNLFEPTNLLAVLSLLVVVVSLPSVFVIYKLETSNPLITFKSTTSAGRMGFVRTMVIAQFVVSVVLVTVSLTVVRQMNFITRSIPSAEHVVRVSPSSNNPLPAEFVNRVLADASIVSASGASTIPSGRLGSRDYTYFMIDADPNFIDMYELKLVEGRGFTEADSTNVMIVNETFVTAHDIKNPMGMVIHINGEDRKIVGIVADFMFESAKKKTDAAVIVNSSFNPNRVGTLYLRMNGDIDRAQDNIRDIYDQTAIEKGNAPKITTLSTIYRELNPAEAKLQTMVGIFSVISMLLTALGLFGLSWYSVQRRVREIAIRKIHGATSYEVMALLCRGFLGWVLIAFVVALPIGYYISAQWLSDFVYRVSLPWWLGCVVAAIAIALTMLTVIFQSLNAANANPANAVRGNG